MFYLMSLTNELNLAALRELEVLRGWLGQRSELVLWLVQVHVVFFINIRQFLKDIRSDQLLEIVSSDESLGKSKVSLVLALVRGKILGAVGLDLRNC